MPTAPLEPVPPSPAELPVEETVLGPMTDAAMDDVPMDEMFQEGAADSADHNGFMAEPVGCFDGGFIESDDEDWDGATFAPVALDGAAKTTLHDCIGGPHPWNNNEMMMKTVLRPDGLVDCEVPIADRDSEASTRASTRGSGSARRSMKRSLAEDDMVLPMRLLKKVTIEVK